MLSSYLPRQVDVKGLRSTKMLNTSLQAIYLTLFYTKREYALRIGYLFVSAAIAGSLGGILGYG
jgi:hypothetical protein